MLVVFVVLAVFAVVVVVAELVAVVVAVVAVVCLVVAVAVSVPGGSVAVAVAVHSVAVGRMPVAAGGAFAADSDVADLSPVPNGYLAIPCLTCLSQDFWRPSRGPCPADLELVQPSRRGGHRPHHHR